MRPRRTVSASAYASLALITLVWALGTAPIAAQTFPTRPIRLVVPYAPGGAVDALARPIAQKLAESIGQPVIIENKPGGNATIGADNVRQAAPDGHSIVLTSINHYLVPYFTRKMPYDALKDFTPIVNVCIAPNTLAVHPSVPIHSVAELIDYAKKNPGKLFYGTTGIGSTHHLGGIMLAQMAAIDIEHVPYKGGNPTMTDVLSGAIPMAIITASTIMPLARQGKLRAIAMIENHRYRGAPEVPSITETVPGYGVPDTWLGILGPVGMASAIVNKLNAEVRAAVNAPDIKGRLESLGFEVTGSGSPEAFVSEIGASLEVFRKIITNAGIKPE
jgi:tripartite-type tricarboxylate transporter receptor subunit TctC